MKTRRGRVFFGLVAGVFLAGSASAIAAMTDTNWAFPKFARTAPGQPPSRVLSIGLVGSNVRHSPAELGDLRHAVDWRPNSHPPMPPVVRDGGSPDALACGFCHLPNGQGRPENAALAGLPASYIAQQVADIRSGTRAGVHPQWVPTALMASVARATAERDVAAAGAYFSKLPFTSRVRVVEAATIPHPAEDGAVYRFSVTAAGEALGQRIVEGPIDFERFEKRDDRTQFIAYAPIGAEVRGRAFAKTGANGRIQPCESCHGAGLRGDLGPPLAGRSPTYLFRQLLAFNRGARQGADAAPMRAVAAKLTTSDMIDVAAYTASLRP